jgi:hypothetical protein
MSEVRFHAGWATIPYAARTMSPVSAVVVVVVVVVVNSIKVLSSP